jgi:hypothetical protein
MPETNVLYSVTAAVVVGLVAWVAVVLKNAKEPWARALAPAPSAERSPDVPMEPSLPEAEAASASEKTGPDADAKADDGSDAEKTAKADAHTS